MRAHESVCSTMSDERKDHRRQNATIDYWNVRKVSTLLFLTFNIFQPSHWNLQSKSVVFFIFNHWFKTGCIYSFLYNNIEYGYIIQNIKSIFIEFLVNNVCSFNIIILKILFFYFFIDSLWIFMKIQDLGSLCELLSNFNITFFAYYFQGK